METALIVAAVIAGLMALVACLFGWMFGSDGDAGVGLGFAASGLAWAALPIVTLEYIKDPVAMSVIAAVSIVVSIGGLALAPSAAEGASRP